MKKRVKIFLLAAVLLATPLAGAAFGHFTQQYSFDEIWVRTWSPLPAEPDRELCIVYPGPTWDDPDPPASRSQSYHAVMNLLRSRRYHKSLLPSSMEDGGTLIYLHEGCIPAPWPTGPMGSCGWRTKTKPGRRIFPAVRVNSGKKWIHY